MFFSLRNYKLHVDQMQSLQLEAEKYATSMADAPAVLHWHMKIDGMDIEFALGSSSTERLLESAQYLTRILIFTKSA